jgi:hypothetical protein
MSESSGDEYRFLSFRAEDQLPAELRLSHIVCPFPIQILRLMGGL